MKTLKIILLFGFIVLINTLSKAQPMTFDENIKLVELALKEDTRKGHEGEKSIITLSTVDSTRYYFVSGHDLWQFLDILVVPLDRGIPLEVSIAQDNWNSPDMVKKTSDAKDEIVSFKTRTWGKFGIKVKSLENKTVNFSIVVLASKPRKSYMGSPFVKIKKSQMKADGGNMASDIGDNRSNESIAGSGGNSGNKFLYVLLGIAILVIALLVGKLWGKKSAAVIILLMSISLPIQAQFTSGEEDGFWYDDEFFSQEDLENGKLSDYLDKNNKFKQYKEYDSRTKDISNKINGIRNTLDNIVNLYKSYYGLTDCINSNPPMAEPRIPSFCTIPATDSEFKDTKTCAGCFLEARNEFNRVRYQFEKLAAIYNCTKNVTDAGIAFGDNVSGYHGVSGLAWQVQRRKIEKSMRKLEQSYDKKYAELLQKLSDSMVKLSECEEKFGVEDWFDRFGYMYFEFIRDKYQRTD